MSSPNSKGKQESTGKTGVYVCKKLPHTCPICNCQVQPAWYVTPKGKYFRNALVTCEKCKRVFVSLGCFLSNNSWFISLNPDETESLINTNGSKKKRTKENKEQNITEKNNKKNKKRDILDVILQNHQFLSEYKKEEFKKVWLNSKLSDKEINSIEAAYFIIANQVRYCYFISTLKIGNRSIGYRSYIVGFDSAIAKKLHDVENGTYIIPKKKVKPFDVIDHIVFNEAALGSQNSIKKENIDKHISNDGKNTIVFVYFRLTNSCMKKQHEIETVTAKTSNAKNGKPISVNVFHCKKCDKYFINYEALQKYISKGIYPALNYSLVNDISGALNDASKLMLYGYSVAEGKLTPFERHSILSWIIDSGLLSKAEIIRDLQFKVRYNGSKPGNEKAKLKWQDDIQFVSRYVQGNSRIINATFVTR